MLLLLLKMMELLQQELGPMSHASFATSSCARINAWETCSNDDVVKVCKSGAEVVGRVGWHASCEAGGIVVPFACVEQWGLISEGPRASKWRRSGANFICATGDIVCSLIWAGNDNDVLTVLSPLHL